jgi:hypothetical protein
MQSRNDSYISYESRHLYDPPRARFRPVRTFNVDTKSAVSNNVNWLI